MNCLASAWIRTVNPSVRDGPYRTHGTSSESLEFWTLLLSYGSRFLTRSHPWLWASFRRLILVLLLPYRPQVAWRRTWRFYHVINYVYYFFGMCNKRHLFSGVSQSYKSVTLAWKCSWFSFLSLRIMKPVWCACLLWNLKWVHNSHVCLASACYNVEQQMIVVCFLFSFATFHRIHINIGFYDNCEC
jgi:hypothetical protein